MAEKFNVLSHDLVPEHKLLTEEEAEAVLAQLGVDRSKLPKIRKDDAAILALEQSYDENGKKVGNIREGSIIKVIRKSKTTQEFVAYRCGGRGGDDVASPVSPREMHLLSRRRGERFPAVLYGKGAGGKTCGAQRVRPVQPGHRPHQAAGGDRSQD